MHTDFDKVHVRNAIRKYHSMQRKKTKVKCKLKIVVLITSKGFKQYQQNICLQCAHIICAQPSVHSNGKRHRGHRFIFN